MILCAWQCWLMFYRLESVYIRDSNSGIHKWHQTSCRPLFLQLHERNCFFFSRLPFGDLLWPFKDLEAEKKISNTVYYNCVEGTWLRAVS